MCELLIRVIDKVSDDTYKNHQCAKRGDVIVVMPDGWGWSTIEETRPEWRILKLPGVAVETLAYLQQSELEAMTKEEAETTTKRTLLRRLRKLNLDIPQIPKAIRDYLADASRAQPFYTVDTTKFNIESIKVDKALVPDI